jgi:hypothetical protein
MGGGLASPDMPPNLRSGIKREFFLEDVMLDANNLLSRCRVLAARAVLPICAVVGLAWLLAPGVAHAQMDQGTIAGTVTDTSGAVIPSADVTLTEVDTGLVLHTKSDAAGTFVFSPIKIGNYALSASAQGMETTTRRNIRLDIQQRLSIEIQLQPGSVSQTVTVEAAPPLMQTQQASVGDVVSTSTINNLPLNGRNWVYIAQLSAGVTPTGGSRGGGTGDFNANGQRAQQNNFILDGVDDNINVVDFMNGASYVVRPPPDALAEFKVDTSDYSAEFGHSAGAVMNVSLKSGSNRMHGSLWEYVRNDALDARNWNATSIPKYRQNQFGATLGLPVLRNKLFFFGDAEANRIIYAETNTETVPTALIRQGNFSELLNPSLTQSGKAITLYEPNSSGTAPLTCGAVQNAYCTGQMDALALKLLNLFPSPNANGSKVFNNYVINRNVRDNTFQWDTRMDWNISSQDQAFARFSYTHEPQYRPPPFGSVLDGGLFQDDGNMINLGENFAFSETHVFTPTFVNEFRFGYNYGSFAFLQPNYATNLAASVGLGGIPYSSTLETGGLPTMTVSGMTAFGTVGYLPTKEGENVYQFLDNVTRILGKHSLKAGINLQSIRFRTLQVAAALGAYTFNGLYTSNLGAANTGYGVADFLADQMNSASISTLSQFNDVRWYRAAYVEDDWQPMPKLTLNLGLRYEYVEPIRENTGRQANFVPSPIGPGSGTGTYVIPSAQHGAVLAPVFTSLLAKDNISLAYSGNLDLINAQKANFAPRLGISYAATDKTVIRGGFGFFYGGLENRGGATNLGNNYPFQFTSSFPASSCTASSCASNGFTLENGFSAAIAAGLQNYVSAATLQSYDVNLKTSYSMEQNLSVERSINNDLAASVAYVSAFSHHLQVPLHPNAAGAITNNANSIQPLRPFPDFGDGQWTSSVADSNYNSLQAKLQKRMSHGYNYLLTYTWSHSLDDAPSALTSDTAYPNTLLIPIRYSYSNSVFDIRNRLTLNGYYELPFGKGRRWLSGGGPLGYVAGGWASSMTFIAQTGQPFTVKTANINAPAGMSSYAIPIADPFKAGGAPSSSNPGISCATQTRTKQHWYNPCAFANPLNGAGIPRTGAGSQIIALPTILNYLGGRRNDVYGPGLTRINMTLFRDFTTFREQHIELRVDAFNVLNTPSYGSPSTADISSNGGLITAPQTTQNLTPDARFFQLSGKYVF